MSASILVVIYMKDSEENNRIALTTLHLCRKFGKKYYLYFQKYLDKSARKQVANLTSLRIIQYFCVALLLFSPINTNIENDQDGDWGKIEKYKVQPVDVDLRSISIIVECVSSLH